MEFDKLNEYADQQALQKQTQFILDLFDQLEKKGAEVAGNLKASFSLFDSKNTGTKAMADEIKNSQLTASNYQKVLAALAAEVDNLSEAQKKTLKDINERFKAEEQARAGAKETVNLIKTEIAQNEKLEAGRSALAKTIAENKIQLQAQNKELMQAARLKEAEIGSNKRLDATIAYLTTRLNKLNQSTDEGKKKAEQYTKSIGKLFELRKQQADPKTAQAMNIGNYQGSAKIIVDAMEAARQKVVQVQQEFGKLSPEAGAARTQFEALQRITNQPQFLNISAKVGDTNAELRFFVKQLNQLEDAGMKNTTVYKDMQARLAHLTDQLGDTRAEVKALSSDTRSFDLFAGSVSFAADAFQTAAGAAQLFGASEKDAQKATATLVAIQSVSNGIKSIANELTTKGTAANKVFAFFQRQVAIAMDTTAKASTRLKAALITTGIGALVVGLGILISKLDLFGDAEEDAKEAAEKLTTQLEEQAAAVDKLNDAIDYSNKIALEKLKQKNASEEDLYKQELSARKAQHDNLLKEDNRVMLQMLDKAAELDKLLKSKMAKASFGTIAHSRFIDQREKLFAEQDALYKAFTKATDKLVKQSQDTEIFKEQYKTKVAQDGFKKREEDAKKNDAERKRLAEQALKDALDLEKRRAAAISGIVNENINEEIRLNEAIIDSDRTTLDEKLAAAEKVQKAKAALLAIEYTDAIASETKIENGKRVIIEKTTEEKLLAETKYQNQTTALLDDNLKKQDALRKADIEKQKQAWEDLKKFLNEGADAVGANESNIIAIRKNQRLIQLDKDFLEGKLKNAEEYEKKKAKITGRAERKDIEAALDTAEQKLEIAIAFGENTLELEKTITELQLQLYDLDVEKAKDTAAKKLAIEQALADKKKELLGASKDLILGIIDGQFERQKNQIEELIQLNEDQKNAEIERVTQSSESEEKKAAQIALIQAQAQAKKEALEKRQKQLDLQKAEFDRIVAIAEVVANVAKAVTKDLAGNKALIPFDLAIGAIQIAAILAKPLPKFKDGLFDDYEGWAITGDGGKKEVIKRASGGIEVTPAKDTLTWINKGDRIEPDADEFFKSMQFGALAAAGRVASATTQEENYGKLMVATLESGLQSNANKIVAAINGKKELHLGATKGGMEALWKHSAGSIKYINENTNW